MLIFILELIGVKETGKRKQCPPDTKKKCCGKGGCVIVSIEDIYDPNTAVIAYNYLEGNFKIIDSTNAELFIPYNKITPQTYQEQFDDGYATFPEEDTILRIL